MKKIIIFIAFISLSFIQKEKWDYDKSDWTHLMLAVYNNDIDNVKLLIITDVDLITYRTKTTWTIDALIVAIRRNNLIAVKELVKTNKFIDLDFYFSIACRQKSVPIISFLLERGVEINKYSENGHSHLMSACSSGTLEIVECLLENDAEVNHQRKVDGITALMLSVFNGKPDKVELLLSYGADKKIKDLNNEVAYDYIENIYERLNIDKKDKLKLKNLLK